MKKLFVAFLAVLLIAGISYAVYDGVYRSLHVLGSAKIGDDLTVGDKLDAAALYMAGTQVTATAAEINSGVDGLTATAAEINTGCDGVTATAAEINTVCDSVLTDSFTWNPGAIPPDSSETKADSLSGAALGDFVLVSAPYDLQDAQVTGYIQSASLIEYVIKNTSAADTLDLASGTWKAKVIR